MTRRRTAGLWWGTLALLALSVTVNVAQARRLPAVITPSRPSMLLGHAVHPIPAIDRDGQAAVVRFDRHVPTVLYYFSPSCGGCDRNWDNVRLLASHADGRYRVVGLAAETSLADFVERQQLTFEVYGGVSAEARDALGVSGTPKTIVVSAQGLITHDWTGAFSGAVALAIEDVFGLTLPGLRLPAASWSSQDLVERS